MLKICDGLYISGIDTSYSEKGRDMYSIYFNNMKSWIVPPKMLFLFLLYSRTNDTNLIYDLMTEYDSYKTDYVYNFLNSAISDGIFEEVIIPKNNLIEKKHNTKVLVNDCDGLGITISQALLLLGYDVTICCELSSEISKSDIDSSIVLEKAMEGSKTIEIISNLKLGYSVVKTIEACNCDKTNYDILVNTKMESFEENIDIPIFNAWDYKRKAKKNNIFEKANLSNECIDAVDALKISQEVCEDIENCVLNGTVF